MSLTPLAPLGQLGLGVAAGGIGAVTNTVSGIASKVPIVGGLISGIANGIGGVAGGLLPNLFK